MSINIDRQILITKSALEMISDMHELKNRVPFPHFNRTGLAQSQVFDLLEGLDPLIPYYIKNYSAATTADEAGNFNWLFFLEYTSDDRAELSRQKAEAKKAASYLSGKLFHDSMPDYIKVYRACAFLSGFLHFRTDAKEIPALHNAYGALIQSTCACQGYAHALQLLLKEANIPCMLISGSVLKNTDYYTSSRFEHDPRTKTTRHYWNLVGIETTYGLRYFHVDSCWGQKDRSMDLGFFLKDDSFMKQFLKWDESAYPVCSVLPEGDMAEKISAGCQ